MVFPFLYARKWKLRDAKQYSLLKDMSEWFMEVAFTKSEEGLEEVLNAYPWIKKEKRILHEILRPYIKWTEKNRILSDQMDEERMQLREEYLPKRKANSPRQEEKHIQTGESFFSTFHHAFYRPYFVCGTPDGKQKSI